MTTLFVFFHICKKIPLEKGNFPIHFIRKIKIITSEKYNLEKIVYQNYSLLQIFYSTSARKLSSTY